jgi:hypothetical protein
MFKSLIEDFFNQTFKIKTSQGKKNQPIVHIWIVKAKIKNLVYCFLYSDKKFLIKVMNWCVFVIVRVYVCVHKGKKPQSIC